MKQMKKYLSIALVLVLLTSVFAGCKAGSEKTEESNTATTPETTGEVIPENVDLSLPIVEEPITLSYFIRMNGAMSATMPTYADVEAMKELEKRTNIKIDWIHPTGGDEQFALMVASDELPDMINWVFSSAKGGAESLLRDEVLIPLSDENLTTYTPNYMKILEQNPAIKMNTILDDGTMYQFINMNYNWETGKQEEFEIVGPYIRMDWVEKVGMEAPTTTDELYEVLKAFKEQDVNGKGNVAPFVDGKGMVAVKSIAGSFGVRWTMQNKNGMYAVKGSNDNYH